MLNGMTSPLAFPHALMVIIAKRYALLFREGTFSFHSSYAATNTCASVNIGPVHSWVRVKYRERRLESRVSTYLYDLYARACVRVVGMCNKTCTMNLCVGAWVIKRGVPLAELTRVSTHPTLAHTIEDLLVKNPRRSRR